MHRRMPQLRPGYPGIHCRAVLRESLTQGVQEMWEAQRSGRPRVPVSEPCRGTPDFYNDESAALLHSYGYSHRYGCSFALRSSLPLPVPGHTCKEHSPPTWQCPRCESKANTNGNSSCDVCGAARPRGGVIPDDGSWTCPARNAAGKPCGARNAGNCASCFRCGAQTPARRDSADDTSAPFVD